MKSPPHAGNGTAARRQPHGSEPKTETDNVQVSADSQAADSWCIPPDDRNGLAIFIGGKGHVVLTQHRPFTDASEIILHPVEALALHGFLLAAIAAADRHRKDSQ